MMNFLPESICLE